MDKILIVENDHDMVIHLKHLLEPDYNVTSADTIDRGELFLNDSNSRPDVHERFSVVIVDLSFEKDGPINELGYQILKTALEDPFIKPIVYTGTGNKEKKLRAFDDGAISFVEKGKSVDDKVASSILRNQIDRAVRIRNLTIACFDHLRDFCELDGPHRKEIEHMFRVLLTLYDEKLGD